MNTSQASCQRGHCYNLEISEYLSKVKSLFEGQVGHLFCLEISKYSSEVKSSQRSKDTLILLKRFWSKVKSRLKGQMGY